MYNIIHWITRSFVIIFQHTRWICTPSSTIEMVINYILTEQAEMLSLTYSTYLS